VRNRRVKAIAPPTAPPIIAAVGAEFGNGPDDGNGNRDESETDGVKVFAVEVSVLGRVVMSEVKA
jgi:hypothetical protein